MRLWWRCHRVLPPRRRRRSSATASNASSPQASRWCRSSSRREGAAERRQPVHRAAGGRRKVDKYYWSEVAQTKAADRANLKKDSLTAAATSAAPARRGGAGGASFGSNDSHATAELVKGFGTGKKVNNRARVLGQLSPETVSREHGLRAAEDDGAIPLAGDTGIGAVRRGVATSGEIGDGPHGSAGDDTGDFDFIQADRDRRPAADRRAPTPRAGRSTRSRPVRRRPASCVARERRRGPGLDSLLDFTFTTSGTYYLWSPAFGRHRVPRRPVRLRPAALGLRQRGAVRARRLARRPGPATSSPSTCWPATCSARR